MGMWPLIRWLEAVWLCGFALRVWHAARLVSACTCSHVTLMTRIVTALVTAAFSLRLSIVPDHLETLNTRLAVCAGGFAQLHESYICGEAKL
jgi:hypothetical protein